MAILSYNNNVHGIHKNTTHCLELHSQLVVGVFQGSCNGLQVVDQHAEKQQGAALKHGQALALYINKTDICVYLYQFACSLFLSQTSPVEELRLTDRKPDSQQ